MVVGVVGLVVVVVVVGTVVAGPIVGGGLVTGLVGGAAAGGGTVSAAVVGATLPRVVGAVTPETDTVVDAGFVVGVELVVVDDSVVSTHSASASVPVVVVVVLAAASADPVDTAANTAAVATIATNTSGATGRPARRWSSRMTHPARTASAPTTSTGPMEPPEIGRSQSWASIGNRGRRRRRG